MPKLADNTKDLCRERVRSKSFKVLNFRLNWWKHETNIHLMFGELHIVIFQRTRKANNLFANAFAFFYDIEHFSTLNLRKCLTSCAPLAQLTCIVEVGCDCYILVGQCFLFVVPSSRGNNSVGCAAHRGCVGSAQMGLRLRAAYTAAAVKPTIIQIQSVIFWVHEFHFPCSCSWGDALNPKNSHVERIQIIHHGSSGRVPFFEKSISVNGHRNSPLAGYRRLALITALYTSFLYTLWVPVSRVFTYQWLRVIYVVI